MTCPTVRKPSRILRAISGCVHIALDSIHLPAHAGQVDAAVRALHAVLGLPDLAQHGRELHEAAIAACSMYMEANGAVGLLRALQNRGLEARLKPYNMVVLTLASCGRAAEVAKLAHELGHELAS
jgi:hypothetical protein